MYLKIKKMKYKFEHNRGENMLFGSNFVRCDAVTPLGDIVFETSLRGPLPAPGKGGLGVELAGRYIQKLGENSVPGLLAGDEIVSVDGVMLANIGSHYERILKLRGEPGSTVHLVIRRVIEKAGTFTEAKVDTLNLPVQRIELRQ